MQPKIGHLIIYPTHFGLFLSSYKADYVYVVICYVTKRKKKIVTDSLFYSQRNLYKNVCPIHEYPLSGRLYMPGFYVSIFYFWNVFHHIQISKDF